MMKSFYIAYATLLVLFLGGCQPKPPTPAEMKAEFIQAVIDEDTTKIGKMLALPNANTVLQLNQPYHTPESDKDPTLRGETLFMWAMRTGRSHAAFLLLDTISKTKNDFGRTPLMYAALYNPEIGPGLDLADSIDSVDRSDFYDVDKNGDSALFLALRRGALHTSTSLLRMHPIDLMSRHNNKGQIALDVAKEGKNKMLIDLIARQTQREFKSFKSHYPRKAATWERQHHLQ